MLETKVQKYGDGGMAVYIPKQLAKQFDIEPGDTVKIDIIKDHDKYGDFILVKK